MTCADPGARVAHAHGDARARYPPTRGQSSRIFEPFFTIKLDGTGIVRDHHGTIDVDSRRDHGTHSH